MKKINSFGISCLKINGAQLKHLDPDLCSLQWLTAHERLHPFLAIQEQMTEGSIIRGVCADTRPCPLGGLIAANEKRRASP